jgi:Zn-dependent protease
MDSIELQEIIASVVAISFAFALGRFKHGIGDLHSVIGTTDFWMMFGITLVTVGLGFVLHELAHRTVARSYGAYAVFRAWPTGLIIMLALAVMGGPIFAAPGAVYIYSQHISRRENGIISIAGPLTNLALAIVFLGLTFVMATYPPGDLITLVGNAFYIGFQVNLFLGLFNMIPIFPLDGSKVFAWNKSFWGSFVLGCLMLMFFF